MTKPLVCYMYTLAHTQFAHIQTTIHPNTIESTIRILSSHLSLFLSLSLSPLAWFNQMQVHFHLATAWVHFFKKKSPFKVPRVKVKGNNR